MQKPATVAYRELSDKLQELLNNCGLPAFVMIPLLREALTQLEALDERQYQRDMTEWNKAVNECEQADKPV